MKESERTRGRCPDNVRPVRQPGSFRSSEAGNPLATSRRSILNVIETSSLRDQCIFCLVHMLWSFVTRSALVPLETVAIPETVLISLLLRHYKQVASGSYTHHIPHWSSVLFTRVPSSTFVEPESNTLSKIHKCDIHMLVKLYRPQW